MITLSKKNFSFQEIEKEYRDNFVCAKDLLSDFHANALCWIGDAIMPKGCSGIYCDNNYWWDCEEHRWSVFMTENGNAMLKDWTDGTLFRICFK